jgi:hypothetical protein
VSSHGDPTSYLQAPKGIDVISADGDRVGALQHVLADEDTSIFDGIVIDIKTGPGGHRFVDAPEIAEFYTNAVVLKIPASDVPSLPEPSANPAAMESHGVEDSDSPLAGKLRRAWEMMKGNY